MHLSTFAMYQYVVKTQTTKQIELITSYE